MNTLVAASLFDSPWIVAVLILVSALANWLAKRRQEKPGGPPPEGEEPAPPASTPPGNFNLEEALRRLMGEEPPRPAPAPPIIPHPTRAELPRAQTRSAEKVSQPEWKRGQAAEQPRTTVRQPEKYIAPQSRPPVVGSEPMIRTQTAREPELQAVRRFEQLNELGRHAATVVRHKHGLRPTSSRPQGALRWRDSRNVRQAFVASLIFAPPKSFEP